MSRIKNGYIPEEIVIITGGEKEIQASYWDDFSVQEKIKVIPAFIADVNSKDSISTGLRWAKGQRHENVVVKEDKRKNSPFGGVKIVSLEHRYGGGRAYKIVDKENHYYDLREDVLLDVMRHTGIRVGAELNGNFVWGKVGSQTKLVRVGSELHSALMEGSDRRAKKKLGLRDLEPGSIYVQKNGKQSLFLGFVDGIEFAIKPTQGTRWNNYYSIHGVADNDRNYQAITGFEVVQTPYKKRLLLCSLHEHDVRKHGSEAAALNRVQNPKDGFYQFSTGTNHSFIDSVGAIKLPSDIVKRIRDAVIAQQLEEISKALADNAKCNPRHSPGFVKANRFVYKSDIYTMHEFGTEQQLHKEVEIILNSRE